MNLVFVILTLTGLSCVFVYGLFLIERTLSFSRYKPIIHSISENSPFVTILIAARNEERNISGLLKSLEVQSYPPSKFEVIIINDFSNDRTVEFAKKSATGLYNFTILTPDFRPETGHKKHALAFGISNAQGSIILTTDADCIVGKEWIKTMVSYFDENTALVSGPVRMKTSDNFFLCIRHWNFPDLLGLVRAQLHLRIQIFVMEQILHIEKMFFMR
jgi:glycosyltransferase involved in cell wall biosynthesis